MARKSTTKSAGGAQGRKKAAPKRKASSAGGRSSTSRASRSSSQDSMGEAFIKLLQSPLVADLVAVAATAALASLAEQGFTSRGSDDGRGKRAGKAVKAAG